MKHLSFWSSYRGSWLDRVRDWDWDVMDILRYVWDIITYHIDRLGLIGYIIVPVSVWVALLMFRPTRWIASMVGIDIWRSSLAQVIGGVFRGLGAALRHGTGLLIARTRLAARSFAKWM